MYERRIIRSRQQRVLRNERISRNRLRSRAKPTWLDLLFRGLANAQQVSLLIYRHEKQCNILHFQTTTLTLHLFLSLLLLYS